MRTLTNMLLLTTLTAACATDPAAPDPSVPTPPAHGIRPVYNVPGGSGAAGLLFGPGSSFVIDGPTAPGTGSFTGAPVTDVDTEPTIGGAGALHLTVDGQIYAAAAIDTYATLIDDGTTSYLALIGQVERPGPNASTIFDGLIVIVPASDFAIGTTVALDGNDRVALFASGDANAEGPTVVAAAVTGTVTFTAGSATIGNTITATVAGDFGAIDFVDAGPSGGTLTDGTYTLALSAPVDVYCEGSLAGQESAFASITAADLGFTGGTVTIGSGGLAISGAPITAAFGTASLALSDSGGVLVGSTDLDAPGPAGTTYVDNYLALDTGSATPMFVNAGVGAGYVTADGQCSIAFGASLSAP
jgi:hypothetical protein